MPLYDYRCDQCQMLFEARVSLKEKEEGVTPLCPTCGAKSVTQVLKPVGLVKKVASGKMSNHAGCGSGFG